MKINKYSPRHWIILLIFTINTILSIFFWFLSKKRSKNIILYGHKLNGNLAAIYQNSLREHDNIYFLTMDPDYYLALKENNIKVLFGLNPFDMIKLSQTSVLISDHGLHSLILLLKSTNIKFLDVWHGIPFKGFDKDDFKVQHQYNETWVTSKLLKSLYIEKFGFQEHKVKVLGYARTDLLINKNRSIIDIKHSIGIPEHLCNRKIILFAPTWIQDNQNRNIYPFQQSESVFLEMLNSICTKTNSICLLRKHLNSPLQSKPYPENIFDCSYANFPDAESILLISDILVCDWSSIAFDYLLLNRPTIFLDVPVPFKKGFSLDESYRFGYISASVEDLLYIIERYLKNPEQYNTEYHIKMTTIRNQLYDDLADGQVSRRCITRIKEIINS